MKLQNANLPMSKWLIQFKRKGALEPTFVPLVSFVTEKGLNCGFFKFVKVSMLVIWPTGCSRLECGGGREDFLVP